MPFVDRREGAPTPGRAWRRCGQHQPALAVKVAPLLFLLVLAGARVEAAPLDEPFVGGLSFSGPTSGTLAAIYWNPAALGLVRGTQVMFAGSMRAASTTVTRAPIDPLTGLPGTFAPGSATASDLMQPVQWPMGPGSFMGISSDLGGDRFTIGFATYMPNLQQTRYPLSPTGTEPTRYQALEIDLRNLALVPALSIRFAGDFRLGIAPGFLFSTGHLAFAQDTALDGGHAGLLSDCGGQPCGAENPAAAARYNIDSGNGLGDAKFSLTLGGGIYYRRQSLEIGLAYSSRPLGGEVSGVEVSGERTTVTQPPRVGLGPVTCRDVLMPANPGDASLRCVFGDLSYRLPDVWIGGVTWKLRPGLELTAMARWIWMHLHDRIDVRLTGPTLQAAGIPEHIVLYRGFRDVWDLRGRIAYWWRERIRVGAQLRLETSAVDPSAVNAAAVDGLKVQPMALAEARLTRHLWLGAGYGITFMPQVQVTTSVFKPAEATSCADAMGDLGKCQARLSGQARPSAAGTYTRAVQDFGLTVTAKF
jgi:long-subunit fatty acid transport protein